MRRTTVKVKGEWQNLTLSRRYIPEPIVTKFETRDYVADIYHHKKLGVNPSRGFCPHIREIYTQNLRMFTFFSQFFRRSIDALVGPIFTFNTSYDVVLRKVVPFGGEKI